MPGPLADKGWTKQTIEDFFVTVMPGRPEADRRAQFFSYSRGAGHRSGWAGSLLDGSAEVLWWQRGDPKVELPANWDKLVQKHKDIVPTYARY